MERLDKSYLVFKADELYYLLELAEVEQIQGGKLEDGVSYLDFSEAVGGTGCAGRNINNYIILLKNEEDGKESVDGKENSESDITEEKTGILVEQIIGIIEIENLKQFPLKAPLINSSNEYLKSIVQIQLETGEKWAYLLHSRALLKRRPVQDMVEPGKVNWGMNQSTEHIEADSKKPCFALLQGEKSLYIAKDRVEAVVIKPTVQRVPMAPEYVLGISFYKEEMVIYYNQSRTRGKEPPGSDSVIQTKNPKDYTCGIIFKTYSGKFAGIAGEATGEAELCLEESESLVTLGNGIWERKSD